MANNLRCLPHFSTFFCVSFASPMHRSPPAANRQDNHAIGNLHGKADGNGTTYPGITTSDDGLFTL